MKAIKWCAVLLLAALTSACVPHGPINWPGLVNCAPGVSDLVGVVSRILLAAGPADQTSIGDRAKQQLEDLAREHGANVVSCVVQRVISDWNAPGAAQEPLRMAAAARGKDFLRVVGSNPTLADESGQIGDPVP